MNRTRTCPRCGHAVPGPNSFCGSCGERLKGGGQVWRLLIGLFALFIGFLWGAAVFNRPGIAPAEPLRTGSSLKGTSAAPAGQTNSLELTSAQHLAEARRALADGYRPDKDPKKALWGKVAAARWHLESVKPADAEYRDAQALLREVAGREKSIESAAKASASPQPTSTPEAVVVERVEDIDDDDSITESDASPEDARQTARTRSGERGREATTGSGGTSSSDYYTNMEGARVRRPTLSSSVPEGASAQCRDGSYSFSRNRRGTCSHHGGVARWL